MYIDSINFYSQLPLPRMLVRSDGDLELRFDNVNRTADPTRYRLFWDLDRNWFGYQDLNIPVYYNLPSSYDDSVYDKSVLEATNIYEGVD